MSIFIVQFRETVKPLMRTSHL